MNKDIQRFDSIQNYLDGNMSAEERQAFEAEMAVDTNLADEVGAHRLEREMMDILLEDDLTEQMQSWQQEKEQMQSGQPKRFNWLKWGMIFIIIIGIILLLIYLLQSSDLTPSSKAPEQKDNSMQKENNLPPNDSEGTSEKKKYDGPIVNAEKKSTEGTPQQNAEMIALAEEFGGTPEFAGTFVRSGEEAKTRFDSASVMIQEKRYDAAIRLLQTIQSDNPEVYLNTRLNLGYLYFIKKNFSSSIPHLEFAAANQDYLYAETAEWYALLAYLADGQRSKFDLKLASILADSEHSYYQKALQLKEQLK